MILRSLELENFGLYGEPTRLDLTPVPGPGGAPRPIILIGGRNGAGKTTFLEAVRLALYGPRALGTRVGRAEYEAYLTGRLHRADGRPAPGAAVSLEFDYVEDGENHRYRVRREWAASRTGGRVVDELRLEKDGSPIVSVPREEWHHFLQELIPPGVSQLFFFDGEKIQEIADSSDDSHQVADAVRSLLGIELISRLRTDLGLYLGRHKRATNDTAGLGGGIEPGLSARPTVAQMEAAVAALQVEISDVYGRVGELRSQRESEARAAEHARRRFVQEGGELASRRVELEAERDALRRRLALAQTDLRVLANELLPLAAAPRVLGGFEALVNRRLKAPDRSHHRATSALTDALAAWRHDPTAKRAGRWDQRHWQDLDVFLAAYRGTTQGRAVDGDSPPERGAHVMREIGDLESVRDRLIELRQVTAPRAAALGDELDALETSLKRVEARLDRADETATSLLLDELRLAEQRVGETGAKLAQREEALAGLRHRLLQLQRERSRLLEVEELDAARSRQTALAGRVGSALAEYEALLMSRKVSRLSWEFGQCFRELARKDDLIARVEVDPETFAMRLFGRYDEEVLRSAMSAGERQIYAVALLWALARSSGRTLPMIIDTPLARLDAEHRLRLVERYFPRASAQTILLSTDTEIEGTLYRGMAPMISHAYRLEYDAAIGRTVVRAGYFEGDGEAPLVAGPSATVARYGRS